MDFEEFVTLLGPKLSTSGIPEKFHGTDFDTVFWKVRPGSLEGCTGATEGSGPCCKVGAVTPPGFCPLGQGLPWGGHCWSRTQGEG